MSISQTASLDSRLSVQIKTWFAAICMAAISAPVEAQVAAPLGIASQSTGNAGLTTPLAAPVQSTALGAAPNPSLSPFGNASALQTPTMAQRGDLGAADAPRNGQAPVARTAPHSAPSQFQRFVQESTGRLLPQFGSNLFDNPQAYATDAAAPASADQVLGQGDEVRIQIWGSLDYAGSHTLDRNGQISLPKIGTVNLSGVMVKDLEATLRKRVTTVFNNVTLSATLGKVRGITVYVVGQAQQPGTYNLSSLSTLVNAVFASGGPSVNGSMRNIQLKRAGQTVTTLDLYDFIAQGDKSKDARLQPGDVIMIPPAGPRVALTGATDHQAIYEIKPGNTVQSILQLGGGLATLTSAQKALLERVQVGQAIPRQVQELVLNPQGLQTLLQDGDVLTLFGISPQFANVVTLRGNVADPLRYSFVSGMRVSDLVPEPRALIQNNYFVRKNGLVQLDVSSNVSNERVVNDVKNLLEEINWEYAAVERLDPKEIKTTLIPFNLGKAVKDKDPQHNLILMPGDVVTVFGVNDLPVPMAKRTQFVRIGGEVQVPGIYPIFPGETLPQLVARVGGITPQAYLFGAEFTRESVRKQQQQNLDQVVRRLEAQAQSASANLAANLTGERAAQASVVQQQQMALQRAQIDKLKAMRSQGRVSLELDPVTSGATKPLVDPSSGQRQLTLDVLPSLPLEDGDAVYVPSRPAFVSAAGSVNNENVLIYKAGRTVGDVIQSAGLSEDAETSEVFVLRADGSVLSRRGKWFFSNFEATPILPGDTVIVPSKVDRESGYNFLVRALRDWTQIFSNLGIGAAAIKTLRN